MTRWREATLDEIAEEGLFDDGDWVESKDQDPSGTVRLVQLADVGVAFFRDRSDRWMRPEQASNLNCTFLETGDILIARMPNPIGRACLVPPGLGPSVTAVDIAILRVQRTDVLPAFAMWAINGPEFHRSVEALQSGTTRKRISRRNLAGLTIPLPPIDEQRRIVDILEDHLSRLDVAEQGIRASIRRTDSLRRSLLSDTLSGRYSAAPRTGPGAWTPVRLDAIAEIKPGRTPSKLEHYLAANPSSGRDIPFYKVGDMNAHPSHLRESRTYLHASELTSLGLETLPAGTVVFPKAGGAIATNKKRVMSRPGAIDLNCMGVVPSPAILSEYLKVWFDAFDLVTISDGSVLPQLSRRRVTELELLLPSLDEQRAVVDTLEEHLSTVNAGRASMEAMLARSVGLRRALLNAAFSGRLTTSSANALLESPTTEGAVP